MWELLRAVHLVGVALGMGAASVKLALLLRCRADRGLLSAYLAVARPITRLIIAGLTLLTLSGIGWLILGYPFTAPLAAKLALVAALWVVGPIIDKVAEPAFRLLVPAAGDSPTPDFLAAERRYLALETTGTLLFYLITLGWLLR